MTLEKHEIDNIYFLLDEYLKDSYQKGFNLQAKVLEDLKKLMETHYGDTL